MEVEVVIYTWKFSFDAGGSFKKSKSRAVATLRELIKIITKIVLVCVVSFYIQE